MAVFALFYSCLATLAATVLAIDATAWKSAGDASIAKVDDRRDRLRVAVCSSSSNSGAAVTMTLPTGLAFRNDVYFYKTIINGVLQLKQGDTIDIQCTSPYKGEKGKVRCSQSTKIDDHAVFHVFDAPKCDIIDVRLVPQRPTWMRDLPNSKKSGHLSRVALPGSHNALSINKRPYLGVTQSLHVYDQLVAGSRYIDVRIAENDDGFVFKHGVIIWDGVNVTETFNFIVHFVTEYPSEVVVVVIQNLGTGVAKIKSDEQHMRLSSLLRETLGPKLFVKDEELTINNILKAKKNIVLLIKDDPRHKAYDEIAYRNQRNILDNRFRSSRDDSRKLLKGFSQQSYNRYKRNDLVIDHAHIAYKFSWADWWNGKSYLVRDMSREVNFDFTVYFLAVAQNSDHCGWADVNSRSLLDTFKWASKAHQLNLFSLDYVEDPGLVDAIIALNHLKC